MENAAEALKIAFSVIMFVLALGMGVSSFSDANRAVQVITDERDREIEYIEGYTDYAYVQHTDELTRIVGVETIIPTMYQAYRENFTIYFFKKDGEPLPLYYKTNSHDGTFVLDGLEKIEVNYIDLSMEGYGKIADKNAPEVAIEHLDIILNKKNALKSDNPLYKLYKNQFIHEQGIYEYLKDKKFEEFVGEYYQGEGASQIKKRVITYTLQ